MHLVLSHVTSLPRVPLLAAALLIMLGIALVLRSRGSSRAGSSSRAGGGRRSGGRRVASRPSAGPNPRFASDSRFAPTPRFAATPQFASDQGGVFMAAPHFAAAQSITPAQPLVAAPHLTATQSITAAQPFVAAPHLAAAQSITAAQPFAAPPRWAPDPGDLFVAGPDLHVVSQPDVSQPDVSVPAAAQPDLRVVVTAPSWSIGPVASVSVLAVLTEDDKARPSFAPSNAGEAFPTRNRALSLLLAHLLAALGIFTLSLAATPIGHHMSRVGGISVWLLATGGVSVGIALAVVVAARVQHDIMGGGWDGGFSPQFLSYISPEVALYVISPSGISAAARRLNASTARAVFVEYGLLVAAFLIVLHRLVGR